MVAKAEAIASPRRVVLDMDGTGVRVHGRHEQTAYNGHALAGAAAGGGRGRGISKRAVTARFVYGTERKLAELMSRELRDLKLVALMIDGVHFAEHVALAVVGVDERGDQHVLGSHA